MNTPAMSDEDRKALEELASELTWAAAAQYLRQETGYGLKDCAEWAMVIGRKYPDSKLAKSKQSST